MKVALVTPIYNPDSKVGMSRYTNILYEGLRKRGTNVKIISFSEEKETNRFKRNLNKLLPFKAIKEMMRAASNRTEIYHFICPELVYNPFAVFQMFLIKNILRKKIVLTVHDMMTLEDAGGQGKTSKTAKYFIKKLIKNSNRILANSEQTREEAARKFKSQKEKIVTAVLGIEEYFKPIKQKFKRKKFVVGYYGAFDIVEDPEFAIRVFSILEKKSEKFAMEMWGSGSEIEKCVSLAKKLKTKNLTINGFSPDDSGLKDYDASSVFLFPVDTYNSFDALLFTSKYEGFGLNILEAIACGVPVVLRKDSKITPELRELCVSGESEEDIAKKITRLSRDKKYREKIIRKGLKKAKNFTWEKNVEKTFQEYRKILK